MLTLKKVKELVEAPVHTKRVPSPKVLLEEGLILMRKEFDHGSHLTVYQSGYVLFSAGKRNTVFHIHDCCGDYSYDGFHVYQGGNEVVLTSKEFALLRLMLENQGKVFTRQMLLDRLWADDLEVEDRIVDSHIKNIRKKLNADYIKTIRGVGYRIDKEN